MVRSGKRTSAALESVLKVREKLDILLIIGTNDLSCFDGTDLQGIELVDTTSNDSYMAALSACDVVVLNYERSRYFHRSSGGIGDAVSVQTYVVCPDFPLLSSQVNYPAKVGVVYQDETDLEIALREALELAGNPDKSVFELHYAERSIAKTADVIDRAIVANLTSERRTG